MLSARSMAEALADRQPELACRVLGNTEAISALFGYLPTPDERRLVDSSIATAMAHIGAEAVAVATAAGAQLHYTDLPGLLAAVNRQFYENSSGNQYATLVFLDYADDGSLIITREHDAKDPRTAAEKCVRAIREGKVVSVGGKDVAVRADAICVHSDTPNAVAIAAAVREAVRPYLSKT